MTMHAKALLGRAVGPLLLPVALRTFFKRSSDAGPPVDALREAMETREQRFLHMVRSEIYARPASPYARLLRHVGCAYGDLEIMVRHDGPEATLLHLAEQGVRLSDDEFRGRVDVVRSGLRFRLRPDDVLPARFAIGLVGNSSGSSSGSPLPCMYSMDWMKLESCGVAALLDAHGLRNHSHATSDTRLTGSGGVKTMVSLGRSGVGCARWFVQGPPLAGALVRAYHAIVAWEISMVARRCGLRFARPRQGNEDDIVAWIEGEQRQGRSCCIRAVVSRAMAITQAATAAHVSLHGTVFIASGEPLTDARHDIIARSGARIAALYGFVPGGLVGLGCGDPEGGRDLHVMQHTHAVVGMPDAGGTRQRLLVSCLSAGAGSIMLNVENGDLAEISTRACGCPFGAAGLHRHLRHVGSDRKLTLQGMNYAVDDLIDFVEQTLPATFGGAIGDYQLLEEDGTGGKSYLTLRVHPRLGARSDADLLEFIRQRLATGSRGKRLMANVWHDTGALRVARQPPTASARGKVPAVLTLPTAARDAAVAGER